MGSQQLRRAWMAAAICAGVWFSGSGAFAQNPTRLTSGTLAPAPIGSLWVPAQGAGYRDKLRMDRFVEELQGMPFTEFLVQVRANGNAYYDSKLAPRAPGVPEDFDPLAELLKRLHAGPNPKKIIAWIDPYHVGNLKDAAPLGENHVLISHPQWLSLTDARQSDDAAGDMFLEPGLPEVQAHLEEIVKELAGKYDIDGIYFDHAGDPAGPAAWGYHDAMTSRWAELKGRAGAPKPDDAGWMAFRADIINKALAGLVAAAQSAKPGIVIGAGVDALGVPPASVEQFAKTATYAQSHQDVAAWMKMAGIGRIYLRDFRSERLAAGEFDGWMNLAGEMGRASGAKIIVGVSGEENDALDAMAQLRRAATSGADGLAVWNYNQPVSDRGSSELFFSSIGRTVLSPEYLTSMARIKSAQGGPLRITPVARGASTTGTLNGLMPLPPPPSMPGVQDENPSAIAEGNGRLISASEAVGAAPRGADAETMAAMERLLANGPGAPAPAAPAGDRPPTRREMIDELLGDPAFRGASDYRQIWSTDEASRELKRKFGNIF